MYVFHLETSSLFGKSHFLFPPPIFEDKEPVFSKRYYWKYYIQTEINWEQVPFRVYYNQKEELSGYLVFCREIYLENLPLVFIIHTEFYQLSFKSLLECIYASKPTPNTNHISFSHPELTYQLILSFCNSPFPFLSITIWTIIIH